MRETLVATPAAIVTGALIERLTFAVGLVACTARGKGGMVAEFCMNVRLADYNTCYDRSDNGCYESDNYKKFFHGFVIAL